jgi:hypothetical protein
MNEDIENREDTEKHLLDKLPVGDDLSCPLCGGFKALFFQLTKMFNQGNNAEFCITPAILQNTCYLPY